MSVAGIMSSALSSLASYSAQSAQNQKQQFKQEFQQLGQDLQSGNLSAAQADFTSLQQAMPQSSSNLSASSISSASSTSSSSAAQSSNSISGEFSQLSQDLQSGNLSAAQSDYAKIQHDFQSQGTQGHHHHHHHGGGGGQGGLGAISQTLDQLGQSLQGGNLSSAQQAYTSLQQEFSQFATRMGTLAAGQFATNSMSVSA